MKRYAYLTTRYENIFSLSEIENPTIVFKMFTGNQQQTSFTEEQFLKELENDDLFSRELLGSGNYSYLTFNGVNWEFAHIETFMSQLKNLESVKSNTIGAEDLFDKYPKLLEGKIITFDFNSTYLEYFKKYIEPFAKQNYGIKQFTSTNGSNRQMAVLKF